MDVPGYLLVAEILSVTTFQMLGPSAHSQSIVGTPGTINKEYSNLHASYSSQNVDDFSGLQWNLTLNQRASSSATVMLRSPSQARGGRQQGGPRIESLWLGWRQSGCVYEEKVTFPERHGPTVLRYDTTDQEEEKAHKCWA
eukprot:1136871-Pelagomonas_calceolata.AAC.1